MVDQPDTKPEGENKEDSNSIQNKLAEKLIGLFDLVISDRTNHFAKNPDKIVDENSVRAIINSYSRTNTAISGGASLVPGPLGMVAILPEIVTIIRNQLAMIYDIGHAYGKSEMVSRELLAGVLATAMGASAGSFLTVQGNKVFVRRVAMRVFQRLITMLAGKIVAQQALKSTLGKWIPLVGPIAMAAWSNYLTQKIGKKTVAIFEKEIVISDESLEETSSEAESIPAAADTLSLDMPKVQTLINLIKIDGVIEAEERAYVQTMINNADLTESERVELLQTLDSTKKFVIDYAAFASSPSDAIGLLVDMVTLAKRDGTFHITEKMFIKQVGKLLGFSADDIDEIMAITE